VDDNDYKVPFTFTGKITGVKFKLGPVRLTEDERTKIYTTQAEYRAKIDELRKEIRQLERKERAEMEKVLTDAQKACLTQHGVTVPTPGQKPASPPSKAPSVTPHAARATELWNTGTSSSPAMLARL